MGLLDFMKSSTDTLDTRNPQQEAADKWMLQMLQKGTPNIPTEQIAGMSESEKLAQKILGQWGGQEAEGLDTLRQMSTASDNILEDPTISALMDVIGKRGDETANRLSRSLMLRGGRGGAGADMLGRSVSDTQKEMLSTLAPYAQAARTQKMNAAQALASLSDDSKIRRLSALSTTGSLPRTLQQLQNSANYQQAIQSVLFPYQQLAPMAGTLSNSQGQSVVQTPSMFSQVAGGIGALAGGFTGT